MNHQKSSLAIMVTGGAGFIGSRVVEKLSKSGNSVISMYHHRLPEACQNVFPFCSDLGSAELLATPLRGVHVVVHAAWQGGLSTGGDAEGETKGRSQNLACFERLLEASLRAKVRRFIFISAVNAHPESDNQFLREKYFSELMLINSKIPEKIILRPSIVFAKKGEDDRFLRLLRRILRVPGIYPSPSIKGKINPICVDDLVESVENACRIEVQQPFNGLAHIMGLEGFSPAQLIRMYLENEIKAARIPVGGNLGFYLMHLLEKSGRRESNLPTLDDYFSLASNIPESENDELKIMPTEIYSFREAISKSSVRPEIESKQFVREVG